MRRVGVLLMVFSPEMVYTAFFEGDVKPWVASWYWHSAAIHIVPITLFTIQLSDFLYKKGKEHDVNFHIFFWYHKTVIGGGKNISCDSILSHVVQLVGLCLLVFPRDSTLSGASQAVRAEWLECKVPLHWTLSLPADIWSLLLCCEGICIYIPCFSVVCNNSYCMHMLFGGFLSNLVFVKLLYERVQLFQCMESEDPFNVTSWWDHESQILS